MEQFTENHKGKILDQAIKMSGYQMQAVARALGIARNTLYTKLKEAEVDDVFIIRISNIIHYDFSKIFPEVYKRVADQVESNPERFYSDKPRGHGSPNEMPHYGTEYKNPYFLQLQTLYEKHIKLMEAYHKLLKILMLLANSNELIGIKKEIMEFLENEEKEY